MLDLLLAVEIDNLVLADGKQKRLDARVPVEIADCLKKPKQRVLKNFFDVVGILYLREEKSPEKRRICSVKSRQCLPVAPEYVSNELVILHGGGSGDYTTGRAR